MREPIDEQGYGYEWNAEADHYIEWLIKVLAMSYTSPSMNSIFVSNFDLTLSTTNSAHESVLARTPPQ